MKPLTLEEIVSRERYAVLRSDYRDAVIAHKRQRRMPLGEKVTLLFEDRETLRFQVQEMIWVEGIQDPEKIQDELDVYNELMPGPRELSATLFIEITESAAIRAELDRLVGLDEHVALGIGGGDDEHWIPARFDAKQMEEDRISAVHYIRFSLDERQADRFADPGVAVRLRVDHPSYAREAPIPEPVRRSLIGDLAGGPAPLLDAGVASVGRHEVLFESGRVRALRPAGAPGRAVVEPIEPVASLLEADDELVVELWDAVRRVAADLVERHGSCRIHADAGPVAGGLRWHLRAPGG